MGFQHFTQGLNFNTSFNDDNNFASTEFFNVRLSVQWHDRHGLTEEELQRMLVKFPVVKKHVGKVDRYECKPFVLQSRDDGQQEHNIRHEATIYFCKRCKDDKFSVVITRAQQEVSYCEERFDEKKEQEQSACWEDVRNEQIQLSICRYVHRILPDKVIDWWCEVPQKSETRAEMNLKKRLAEERFKVHEDSALGYALYEGLQTRKLLCEGPTDDLFPAVFDLHD